MKLIKWLKIKAKLLKQEIIVIYYAYKNPETPLIPKIIIIFTLGYAMSPIDLIPDFIPVIGFLDDVIIIPLLIAISLKFIPIEIIEESRQKAVKEPLSLKKNIWFGIIFIIIWIVILLFTGHYLYNLFYKK